MKIKELLDESRVLLYGNPESEITGIAYDTRKLEPGNLFVCIKGTKSDGHEYIDKAIELGAGAIAVTDEPEETPGACHQDAGRPRLLKCDEHNLVRASRR